MALIIAGVLAAIWNILRGRGAVGVVAMVLGLLLGIAVAACGPRTVRLTVPDLQELERCVLEAPDEVEERSLSRLLRGCSISWASKRTTRLQTYSQALV